MKNGPLLTAAAITVTALGAFMAGRASSSSPESAATAAADPAPRIQRPAGTGSDPSLASRLRASDRETTRGGSPTGSASEEMRRIITTTDPLARTQAWLDYVRTLDPGEFESVVAEFRGSGFTNDNMAEYAMLLTAWAGHDPLSALDYAKENTGNSFARNTILTSWAATDPDSAIAWATQNHEGDNANPWMVGVIKGLAAHDPARASQLLQDMPRSRERGDALGALVPVMLAQGTDAAKSWALGIGDESLRDGIIGRLAGDLARTDPEGTARWLASTGGNGAAGAIDDVITSWASKDPQAATSWFQSLPAGDNRSNALRGLANQMAMSDPRAAAAFIDSHAADANDRVYQQFVWHSFGEDPALAANYISRIEDPGQQEGMYRRMLDGWLRRDYDAAAQFIHSTPLPENVANRVAERMREIQQGRQ